MTNVSGPLQVGTTFTFLMNDGKSFETCILDVCEETRHNRKFKSLIFSTSLLCGALEFRGEIMMTQSDPTLEKVIRTDIQYAFNAHGCCACLLGLNSNIQREVANGVKVGLANIIRISDQASRE